MVIQAPNEENKQAASRQSTSIANPKKPNPDYLEPDKPELSKPKHWTTAFKKGQCIPKILEESKNDPQ